MRRFVLILLIVVSSHWPVHAQAAPMREFVMSCTYGVLAGTLVGAATLAFTEQPGDNLNNVARGASLGLYTGILLGLYVVYVVPGQIEESEDDYLSPDVPSEFPESRFQLGPTLNPRDKTVDGAQMIWEVTRF